VDPLQKTYPALSVYQFAGNTPIEAADLDGKETWHCSAQDDPVDSRTPAEKFIDWLFNTPKAIAKDASTAVRFINQDPKDPVPLAEGLLATAKAELLFVFPEEEGTTWSTYSFKTVSERSPVLEQEIDASTAKATDKSAGAAHKSTEASESNTANGQASLQQRAQEIHEKQATFAQSKTTTAVGEGLTENGEKVRLVASSNARLSPAQRAALKPGEIPINNKALNLKSRIKVHAEQKITRYAILKNINLAAVAPSRPACPSCVISVENSGAQLEGEIKKVPSQ
jgi:hypothetical protein